MLPSDADSRRRSATMSWPADLNREPALFEGSDAIRDAGEVT
jgi:hypothetical protein